MNDNDKISDEEKCRHTSPGLILHDGTQLPPLVCVLADGHEDEHTDGSATWAHFADGFKEAARMYAADLGDLRARIGDLADALAANAEDHAADRENGERATGWAEAYRDAALRLRRLTTVD